MNHYFTLQFLFFQAKIVEKYFDKRVFLAGDSAHLTPPFAVQGLASGLRDASNLAWKLAFVCKNLLNDKILSTYQTERYAHQKKMIFLAIFLGVLMTAINDFFAFFIISFLKIINKMPFLKKYFELRGDKITANYKNGYVSKSAYAGTYLIQPKVKVGDKDLLLDQILGSSFAIICFDSIENIFSDEQRLAWESLDSKFLIYNSDFIDEQNIFANFYDLQKLKVLIIRPDRFIFASDPVMPIF